MFGMFTTGGKYQSVSNFRRLVTDLMHFSSKVPSVTIERRHELGPAYRRANCARPPTWSSIFTKAYALVAARTPRLRTCYLSFPWPRFFENAVNVATINVDRQLKDERIVVHAYITAPETLSLAEIDAIINFHKMSQSTTSRRTMSRQDDLAMCLGRCRRWTWWAALNIFGPVRCRYFGTFGITSVCSYGWAFSNWPLLTSTMHYGMFDPRRMHADATGIRPSCHRRCDSRPSAGGSGEGAAE